MQPPMKTNSPDDFQTPASALDNLLPFIKKEWTIWECASGNGNIAKRLSDNGNTVITSDIKDGRSFLLWQPDNFDCIITNPPFSIKQQFLERCFSFNKPFALLLPLTTLETSKRQNLFKKYGVEIILFSKRVNFETPNGVNGASWFATAWFTNGLNIGKEILFP